jgi:hypothetical protein
VVIVARHPELVQLAAAVAGPQPLADLGEAQPGFAPAEGGGLEHGPDLAPLRP